MNNKIKEILSSCNICPNKCNVNRNKKDNGICGFGADIVVSSYGPHYGEEPELVGFGGSGTIFFTGCNLLCIFCQNYEISHLKEGFKISISQLSKIMISLQDMGCYNINLVTPSHFTPQILESIELSKSYGLSIPIIWNTNGYEKIETIRSLKGLVDIYMPDLKFVSSYKSKLFSEAEDYFHYASKAIVEMYKQVGDLVIKNGRAKRGLLIRHLILPSNKSDTIDVINFIASEIGVNTYLNLMDQYRPCYKAYHITAINRYLTKEEYKYYIDYAKNKGFSRPEYLYSLK